MIALKLTIWGYVYHDLPDFFDLDFFGIWQPIVVQIYVIMVILSRCICILYTSLDHDISYTLCHNYNLNKEEKEDEQKEPQTLYICLCQHAQILERNTIKDSSFDSLSSSLPPPLFFSFKRVVNCCHDHPNPWIQGTRRFQIWRIRTY